jgi:hypothetical protein
MLDSPRKASIAKQVDSILPKPWLPRSAQVSVGLDSLSGPPEALRSLSQYPCPGDSSMLYRVSDQCQQYAPPRHWNRNCLEHRSQGELQRGPIRLTTSNGGWLELPRPGPGHRPRKASRTLLEPSRQTFGANTRNALQTDMEATHSPRLNAPTISSAWGSGTRQRPLNCGRPSCEFGRYGSW